MSAVPVLNRWKSSAGALPPVSRGLIRLFARYTRGYLRRHFHSVRLCRSGWQPVTGDGVPTVVYLNHASWWDPLVSLHLWSERFPGTTAYAPIDATALNRYAFLGRLGFFGVEPDSHRGAARFLAVARGVASRTGTMLWVTPQARFADVRDRPLAFRPGLGHLAARLNRPCRSETTPPVRFLPLAIEYTHWQERLPEVLLRFGEPLLVSPAPTRPVDADQFTRELERRLALTMDALADASRRRNPTEFEPLLRGSAGVNAAYDLWGRIRAALRGQAFQPRHGNL